MVNLTVHREGNPPVTGASLHLDAEELWFLVDVLSCVGGDPRTTRRKHQKAIYDALEEQGITWADSPYRAENRFRLSDIEKGRESLWFTE